MEQEQPTLTYTLASINDLEQLTELALIAYGQYAKVIGADNWSLMENNIKNKFVHVLQKATTFLCVCNGQIVGMACLIPSGNPDDIYDAYCAQVRMVAIHPTHSGRGICRTLMNSCIDHAAKTNEKTVALHTSEFMDAAKHIYESMGFKIIREIGFRFGKQYWLYTLDISNSKK